MLVVDSSVAVPECTTASPFSTYADELVAPPLMWSEARSAFHEAVYRGELQPEDGRTFLERLERLPVRAMSPRRLGPEAWRLADDLGWAKTYDAEYLALASVLACQLVTLDGRLRRGADRLGFVVSPTEL